MKKIQSLINSGFASYMEVNTMGKLYTLDKKLLIGSPEIEIGDNKYSIDDRTKTVRKVMKLSAQLKEDGKDESPEKFDVIDQIMELAFGANSREVSEVLGNLPFKAYLEVIDTVIDAMTNGDPEEYEKKKAEKKGEDFRSSGGDLV